MFMGTAAAGIGAETSWKTGAQKELHKEIFLKRSFWKYRYCLDIADPKILYSPVFSETVPWKEAIGSKRKIDWNLWGVTS